MVFFYWNVEGFAEDFGGEAGVVMDEFGTGVEASCKAGESAEEFGFVQIHEEVGGDDEIVFCGEDLGGEVVGGGVEVGDDFGADVDRVDLAVEGTQVVELMAFERDVVSEFFATGEVEAGAGEEDPFGRDVEGGKSSEAFW